MEKPEAQHRIIGTELGLLRVIEPHHLTAAEAVARMRDLHDAAAGDAQSHAAAR